eukprot:TRINITY_DN1759_c0_g4_i1.p1 TRINITY_DN1759_c0_g4~~TRINITY_DN1759_c0_g4_i1.p1  ORF type:complete len:466 (+),score=121.57 TRINITY_DN1759_c0_g4_i1:106-1503(+)
MSYRELKSFAEIMRMLGYPRPISLESFRLPNFELVADCTLWLVTQFEPSIEIDDNIATAQRRVAFLKDACAICLNKANVKLNMKRLYAADGNAVRELLKMASLLHRAITLHDAPDDEDETHDTIRPGDPQDTRKTASELTEEGYKLHELLEAELKNRDLRNKIVARPPEMSEIERALNMTLEAVREQVTQLTKACTSLAADEASLESKIENKAAQLERNQKRLSSLMSVRPAFMDEYDAMEAELHKQYKQYLEQFRNLGYLEYELAKYNKKEDILVEEQEHRLHAMREKLRKEELEVLRGQRAPEDSILDMKRDRELEAQLENEEAGRVVRAEQQQDGVLNGTVVEERKRGTSARGTKRQRPESGRPQVKPRNAQAMGNMYGGNESDDSDESDETSSDGALSLNDGTDSDDDDETDSGDDDDSDDDDDETDDDDDDDETDEDEDDDDDDDDETDDDDDDDDDSDM